MKSLIVNGATLSLTLIFLPALAEEKTDSPPDGIEEVIVSGKKKQDISHIDPETEKLFNVAGAGLDPLAAVFSLPGVTFASDFGSEPAVRGSAPGDNAYYIDFIPARYVFHIFGNSIFNENLIHKFDLYPAAFPSEYSNATGAVIDVTLREPKKQPLTVTANWSFILTGAMVESQLSENQAFYASYRRSLIDKFVDKEDGDDEDEGREVDKLPISDDYQLKYAWNINSDHQLSLVAAGADDTVAATFSQNSNEVQVDPDFAGPASITLGFDSQGLVWEWVPGKGDQRLKMLLSHIIEKDDVSYGTGQFQLIDTERYIARAEHGFSFTDSHWLTVGISAEQAELDASINVKYVPCDEITVYCPTVDAEFLAFDTRLKLQYDTAYLEDQWQINEALLLTSGLHYSRDDYLDRERLEPRLRLNYAVNDNWSLSTAAGLHSQMPELVEILEETGNPDLDYIDAVHYVIGVENILADGWSWHSDLYLKELDNKVISVTDPELADFGKIYTNNASGTAYGLEFLVDKKLTDKWYGWLALSLSRTERTNDYTGETRRFDFDRPVMLNLVANYQLSQDWMLGFKWTIQSGLLYTPIVDIKNNENQPEVLEPVYGDLNSERLPVYHRLDVRAEFRRPTGYGYWILFVDLLNAYNQENVEGYAFSPNGNDLDSSTPDGFGEDVAVRSEIGIGFFPSIGFEIQF